MSVQFAAVDTKILSLKKFSVKIELICGSENYVLLFPNEGSNLQFKTLSPTFLH